MKDMTTGSPFKNIFYFSLPMLFGNVFQQLYNVIDSIIVGQFIGKQALAAVGASFPIMFFMIALLTGATMGSTVLVSQFYGAKDGVRLKSMTDTTYFFLLLLSIGLTVLGLAIDGWVLHLMNTPADIYNDAKLYIDILFIGMFTMIGYNGISSILRGVGDSKTPLYLLIISTIVNIGLDLLFVVTFGWGIAGAAWATVIAQLVSFIATVILLKRKSPALAIRLSGLNLDFGMFFKSIKIGLPSGIQQMAVAMGFMALTRIVNGFGTNAIAAFTAAGRIDSFAMMPAMNFSMAVSTFVGQNIGAKREDRVKAGLKATLVMSLAVSVFITLCMLIFGENLIRLFSHDAQIIKIGKEYLYIVSSFYIFFSSMFVVNGVLRGAGDTFIPMCITIMSLWLFRIPIAACLSTIWGTAGIWWGIPIAWVLGAVLAYLYFKTGKWKTKTAIRSFR